MSIDPVSIGITVALTAAQMALQAMNRLQGPRLDDLSVALGDYGSRLPIFWGTRRFDGCPIFFAEPLHEVHREAKTKGGKYNEYTYFATFAFILAGHEISGVKRIWFDKHLVYDNTGVGPQTPFPISYSNIANKGKGTATTQIALSDHLRIYLGTTTQLPDVRMQATVEAAHGVDTCPAYRDTAYVMIEELPVEKFGNRVPQPAAEVVSLIAPAYPVEGFTAPGQPKLYNTAISKDGTRILWAGSNYYQLWDLPSRTPINSGTPPLSLLFDGQVGMFKDGRIISVSPGAALGADLVIFSSDMTAIVQHEVGAFPVSPAPTRVQKSIFVCEDVSGNEYWGSVPFTTVKYFYFSPDGIFTSLVAQRMLDITGVNWRPTHYFSDRDGNIWAIGTTTDAGSFTVTDAHFYCLEGERLGDWITTPGLPGMIGTPIISGFHYRDDTHDQFVFTWAGGLYAADPVTGAVLDSLSVSLLAEGTQGQFANLPADAESVWVNTNTEVRLSDLSVIRTVTLANWSAENTTGMLYLPVLNGLLTFPSPGSTFSIRYLDRITGDTVTLGQIASDVADLVGIEDYDFSALTQEIDGYSVTLGSGRDMLEPLFTVYDCDIAPHDFGVRGVLRGGTASTTLTTEWFVRQGDEPRYTVTLKQAAELPRAMVSNFADLDKDQQTNTVRKAIPVESTDAKGEQAIDLTTLALHADDAADLNDRALRRIWGGRRSFNLSLTAQQLRLEPGDLRILDLDGETVTARLTRATFRADDIITTEWEYDHPFLNSLAGLTGPGFDGRREEAIFIAGPVKGAILDIPLVSDAHESRVPFLYFGAGSYGGTAFVGADIWSSDTLAYDDYVGGWGAVPSSNAMTWGVATNALPDALAWIPDRGSTLNVKFMGGSPTGATEAELLLDNELNLIALGNHTDGWELLQFGSATLETDGSWTLSTFLRGRRGTEHRMADHAAGDMLILLATTAARKTMGTSEIGDTDAYRAVPGGRTLDAAAETRVAFTGAAQKPLSPVHGLWSLDTGSGDWSAMATRRTRIGGANIDGQDVPLGETSESWSLDILDTGVVVRTIPGTSLPILYTSADQTTDFGAPLTDPPESNLYQVAPDLNLRGYPLALAA